MDPLERVLQWQQLNAAIRGACEGEGTIVLVGGEEGIGKTPFVTVLAGSFRSLGRVLWGACDPLFTPAR